MEANAERQEKSIVLYGGDRTEQGKLGRCKGTGMCYRRSGIPDVVLTRAA